MQDLLLIEDDEMLIELLKDRFEKEGLRVHCADRMDQALELFRLHSVGLVITDFHIQQGSGRKMVHEIKKIKPETPVFLMTGTPYVTEADFTIYGFDKIFLKPFSLPALLEEVRKVLK
jgi:DNA-binding NtrC family response regulator